jgi:hypothetical protein
MLSHGHATPRNASLETSTPSLQRYIDLLGDLLLVRSGSSHYIEMRQTLGRSDALLGLFAVHLAEAIQAFGRLDGMTSAFPNQFETATADYIGRPLIDLKNPLDFGG